MPQRYSAEKISRDLPGHLPPERRRCKYCFKVMRPHIEWREAKQGEEGVRRYNAYFVPVRVEHYGYGKANLFCTLTCAYRWAVRSIRGLG